MSKRDLKILCKEEREADVAINRFAEEKGILRCVGFRKGIFTYVDMSVATGKFRLTSQPQATFDMTATDIKLKYSMSSVRTSVSIRVVTHLNESYHFSKPAFEHHWTIEEWYRTYPAAWQTIQAKWPRQSLEKANRTDADVPKKRGKSISSDEIEELVAKLQDLEISNNELRTSNQNYQMEADAHGRQQQQMEDLQLRLSAKERELAEREQELLHWWAQKNDYEKQKIEDARQKDVQRRQQVTERFI